MPGKSPVLKRAARSLAKQLEALSLIGRGLPITEAARQMDLTPANVRRHLHAALKSGLTLYPHALSSEEVNSLRQVEAEQLRTAQRKILESLSVIRPDEAIKIARLSEALARINERQSAMWGLNMPTRIQEESMRFQINATQGGDGKVAISFDRSQIDAMAAAPCPELTMESEPFVELVAALPPGTNGDGDMLAHSLAGKVADTSSNALSGQM
jgi:hypothetical protein